MKKTFTVFLALLLAITLFLSLPAKVFADSTTEKYVSEIRLGVDKKADKALAALDGYEILKGADGKPVDLNKDAGGGTGSKGDRVVYLGFKRTSDRSEAVTDLAVMNMNGGYKVEDYKALMEKQMKEQILPFVDGFMAAIEEYRENYTSSVPANQERAAYIHDMLNELTDDDCGGAGLGDLLLNETKYEMGDAAYNALSDADKKQHADIVTIVAQANGKATYIMANLLTRAADTAEDTWLERFASTTYEDMEDETGLSPSKARQQLARLYEDDALKILESWDALREALLGAEQDAADVEAAEAPDDSVIDAKVQAVEDGYSDEKMIDAVEEILDQTNERYDVYNKFCNFAASAYLSETEYEDGTLYDFFTQTYEDIEDDITVLYPLVAALSAGQKAGMEFISLREMILIAAIDGEGYKTVEGEMFSGGSIYDGVDREIFEPGAVALTSDAIRTEKALRTEDDTSDSPLHWYNYALMGLAGVSAIGCAASYIYNLKLINSRAFNECERLLETTFAKGDPKYVKKLHDLRDLYDTQMKYNSAQFKNIDKEAWVQEQFAAEKQATVEKLESFQAKNTVSKWLSVGFAVATVVITAVTLWLTFRDLKNYYKVDYTPIPRYIVDEKDITAYNARGEKIVIKNQEAYYKAVHCNRTADADFYSVLGSIGDLNGDVGRQWLALYAERNRANAPILADSFKVSDQEQIPAGYELGIHMFGSAAVENLNNPLYVWKSDAPKVFVYFKVDASAANNGAGATGSVFSGGMLALTGAAGLALGALAAALCMTAFRKRKEKAAA